MFMNMDKLYSFLENKTVNYLTHKKALKAYEKSKKKTILTEIWSWLDALIFAVVVVIILNQFLFQLFLIPSPSMVSTLNIGDRVIVSKVSYGIEAYPTGPKLFSDSRRVQRDDIITFYNPEYDSKGPFFDILSQIIYYSTLSLVNIDRNEDGSIAGIDFKILIGLGSVAVGLFAGQFIAMGITPVIIKKVEKKTLYNFYSIAGAVPFVLIFVFFKIANGDLTSTFWSIMVGLCMLFASASFGGINVLQSVMIADCVDYEEYTNGVRTDGVFFSGQSFITKLSAGIATLISSGVYAFVGYSGENVDRLNKAIYEEGASFITYDGGSGVGKYAAAMFFLISIPPAIGMVLSALPTLKYALSDKEHERILAELVAKRNEEKTENED